jgi:hypothetical protein
VHGIKLESLAEFFLPIKLMFTFSPPKLYTMLNYNYTQSIKLCILAFTIMFLFSCGSGNKNHDNPTQEDSTTVSNASEELNQFNFILPSPIQIASVFHRAGLKYNEQFTNPVSNKSKYESEFSRAVNIGTYGADMAYGLINEQHQNTLNIMKATKSLSDELGMGSLYEIDHFMERFINNTSKPDSLTPLLLGLQTETEMYLEENHKLHIYALMFAGGWLESMYIATKSIENNKNEKIMKRLAEQRNTLEALLKTLENYEGKDSKITDLKNDFLALNTAFENCADFKAQPIEEDGTKPLTFKIALEELQLIAAKISEIRTKIING